MLQENWSQYVLYVSASPDFKYVSNSSYTVYSALGGGCITTCYTRRPIRPYEWQLSDEYTTHSSGHRNSNLLIACHVQHHNRTPLKSDTW